MGKDFNHLKVSDLQSRLISEQLSVQKGCRQRDTISPYLFILCAKVLGVLVKHNENIRAIIVESEEH